MIRPSHNVAKKGSILNGMRIACPFCGKVQFVVPFKDQICQSGLCEKQIYLQFDRKGYVKQVSKRLK